MISLSLAELLETLVDIPSETGHESAIADWVVARLRSLGRGECLRSGNSVVWRSRAPGALARDEGDPLPLLVMAGHLDTVPARGNQRARHADGRIYGVGSSDMKCGDAVMLALAEALDPASLRFDLAAVFYDAEEGPYENNGLERLLREMPWLLKARLAILLEPTDLRVELGCNGVINAEVRVAGKSAHSARPWTGLNAIGRAAPWLAGVTRFPQAEVEVGGVRFMETLQVTTLAAGHARNVVPDRLVANLNYRFPPDRSPEDAERKLRGLVPESFEFRVVDRALPGRVCSAEPEVREFIERFRAEVAGKQAWTDVARLTAAGIPAFNFGPGLPEQAHQVNEYCPVENLEAVLGRLRDFVTKEAA